MDIVTTPTQTNYNFLGVCEFCGLEMGPMTGIPKSKRLQYHILRKCKKYPPSRPATSTATPPPTMPVPHTGTSAADQAYQNFRTQRDAVKPKPKICMTVMIGRYTRTFCPPSVQKPIFPIFDYISRYSFYSINIYDRSCITLFYPIISPRGLLYF